MSAQDRQIRQLRLKVADASALHKAQFLLEDAFHTASLPGLPPSALVFIKRLALGRFSSRISPASLSEIIDTKMRKLASTAVCIDLQDARDADVVWISDRTVAYGRLIQKLVESGCAIEWYWQHLVNKRLDSHASATLVNHILHLALGDYQEPNTQASLIDYIAREQVLDSTLAVINEQTAIRSLYRVTGLSHKHLISPAPPRRQFDVEAFIPTERMLATQTWIHRWGANDVRSHWLVHNIMVHNNPALLERSQINILLNLLVEHLSTRRILTEPEETPASESAVSIFDEKVSTQETTRNNSIAEVERERLGKGETRELDDLPSVRPARPEYREKHDRIEPTGRRSKLTNHFELETRITEAIPVKEKALRRKKKQHQQSTQRPISQKIASHGENPVDDNSPQHYQRKTPCYGEDATDNAGLLFLITLMENLGMRTLLRDSATLSEANFPGMLLSSLSIRYGIPASDPVRDICPELHPTSDFDEPLTVPEAWRSLLAGPDHHADFRAYQYENTDSAIITTKNKNIIIHLGRVHAGKIVNPLSYYEMPLEPKPADDTFFSLLLRSWQLIMARYLWRFGGISLRQLIRRPALIKVSNTHVDVFFSLAQADTRLRQLALDLDPLWIPWLGRVIQYHYVDLDDYDPVHP